MKQVSVYVAEESELFRAALMNAILTFDRVSSVQGVASNAELFRLLSKMVPDVLVLDLASQVDGDKLIRQLSVGYPSVKILFVSIYDHFTQVCAAINAGAHGYVSKGDDLKELESAISRIIDTGIFRDSRIERSFQRAGMKNAIKKKSFRPILSEPELLTMEYLLKGHSIDEISNLLGLNKTVVRDHKIRIIRKTGYPLTNSIIKYALGEKIKSENQVTDLGHLLTAKPVKQDA